MVTLLLRINLIWSPLARYEAELPPERDVPLVVLIQQVTPRHIDKLPWPVTFYIQQRRHFVSIIEGENTKAIATA